MSCKTPQGRGPRARERIDRSSGALRDPDRSRLTDGGRSRVVRAQARLERCFTPRLLQHERPNALGTRFCKNKVRSR